MDHPLRSGYRGWISRTRSGRRFYARNFEALDGRDHLACYDLMPELWSEWITTRDQFTDVTPDEGLVVEERMLCVPMLKTYERVPSLAPWGIATLGLSMLLMVFWVAERRARYGRSA